MKKKILIIIVLLVGASCFLYFWNKFSYADQKDYFPSETKSENGLQVGIIGDSWVVRQKLDSLLERKLLDKGIRANVFSSGNPGAKTKRIYENLFKDESEEFSSKTIIEKKPDYCIVIAGVNDAATHMGFEFYTWHMTMIINTLLHYGIKPVIVIIPEFGLEDDFKRKNFVSALSNRGAEFLLNKGEPFTIEDYRSALLAELKRTKLNNKVVLLNFDEVSRDYDHDRNLYSDPLHLNKVGYQRFSEFLAAGIINLENTK
jgi:lysophospholipase L1-like esterase